MLLFTGMMAAGVGILYSAGSSDSSGQDIQPVSFSHARHAGRLKVDCLYCHRFCRYLRDGWCSVRAIVYELPSKFDQRNSGDTQASEVLGTTRADTLGAAAVVAGLCLLHP